MSENVFVKSGRVTDILPNTTTNTTGNWMFKDAPKAAFQAVVTGTGAVTAQSGDYTFSQIGSKPTTLSGYGITDGLTTTTGDARYPMKE